ncbi:MAG: hypothetical protein IPM57_05635 [Oligoflexia bacterium]|nr:hypothetical protein [Oligoflexia bacterium]
MNNRFYDVLVYKEYITAHSGVEEKKVAWNRVGRSWVSQSGECLNMELFLFPNQRYVIQLNPKESENKK